MVAEDCRSVEFVDGDRVRPDDNAIPESAVGKFDDLLAVLFKEDREKAAKVEAEKNVKKVPGKDDKKKDEKKKDDRQSPVAQKRDMDKKLQPDLKTMGSVEFENDHFKIMEKFEVNENITNPFKIQLSVRTLEKAETIYFDELADDPNFKKDDFQACFWIEFDLSR